MSPDEFRNGSSSSRITDFPPDNNGVDYSTPLSLTDKFTSSFEPWGDYVFGVVMIVVGESSYFVCRFYFLWFPRLLITRLRHSQNFFVPILNISVSLFQLGMVVWTMEMPQMFVCV